MVDHTSLEVAYEPSSSFVQSVHNDEYALSKCNNDRSSSETTLPQATCPSHVCPNVQGVSRAVGYENAG
jgi:hypothetical protein